MLTDCCSTTRDSANHPWSLSTLQPDEGTREEPSGNGLQLVFNQLEARLSLKGYKYQDNRHFNLQSSVSIRFNWCYKVEVRVARVIRAARRPRPQTFLQRAAIYPRDSYKHSQLPYLTLSCFWHHTTNIRDLRPSKVSLRSTLLNTSTHKTI